MMNVMETGGGTVMQEGFSNSNDEESGDDGSSTGGDGPRDVKDRAAKEAKMNLARSETRAGTLRLAC
jgi:hypothetical protein